MARRVSLPTADDLFRATEQEKAQDGQETGATGGAGLRQSGGVSRSRAAVHAVPDQPEDDDQPEARTKPSGRVKHDEKMTVYVTADELLEIEHARLALRSRHGLAVDRGRLVREAIHLVLADLERNGDASALVRRLTEE